MRCRIEGLTHLGEGVTRLDGKAVFVPYALPEEVVDIEIIASRRNYDRGRLLNIVDASPDRTEPRCPHYYQCGGCAYQHVDYAGQLKLKARILKENLRHIGQVETTDIKVLGMEDPWCYRNKATWHWAAQAGDGMALGYYRSSSHRIIDVNSCFIVEKSVESMMNKLRSQLTSLKKINARADFVIRKSSWDQKHLLLVEGLEDQERERVYDVCRTLADSVLVRGKNGLKNFKGEPHLYQNLGLVKYNLSPSSFWQVNDRQNHVLIKIIKEWLGLQGAEKILDAYCGVGSISLQLARQAGEVTGIEAYEQAVADARRNADLNGITNCRFLSGSCEKLLLNSPTKYDAVVIDPPRGGCHPVMAEALLNIAAPKLIYISCNPATLARDLSWLCAGGYGLAKICLLDMFPQTASIETVCLLVR